MNILKSLTPLVDPRKQHMISYPLTELVFMAICSVLGGSTCWQDIHDFVSLNKKWFKKYVNLKDGIPSHDTFRRIFMIVDHEQIQKLFIAWSKSLLTKPTKQIAVDGKALRGSGSKKSRIQPLNFVSAWCYENGIILGQVPAKAKSNEITAIPELLEQLVIKGCLISIDAAGCQKEIVKKITSKGADYLIALKGNQKTLHEMAVKQMKDKINNSKYLKHDKFDETHGRLVRRRSFTAPVSSEMKKMGWHKLASITAIETVYSKNSDKDINAEWRYYISSNSPDDTNIHKYIRDHWSIENNLHWILDVHMDDDANRSQERNSTLALASLKRIAINIVKTHDKDTISIRRKLKKCSWDITHLEKLILKT